MEQQESHGKLRWGETQVSNLGNAAPLSNRDKSAVPAHPSINHRQLPPLPEAQANPRPASQSGRPSPPSRPVSQGGGGQSRAASQSERPAASLGQGEASREGTGDEGERSRAEGPSLEATTDSFTDGTATTTSAGVTDDDDDNDDDEDGKVEEEGRGGDAAAGLSRWERRERELNELRVQAVLQHFRQHGYSTMPGTSFSVSLPSVKDQEARRERRMHGLMSRQASSRGIDEVLTGVPAKLTDGDVTAASNVHRNKMGGVTMAIGDLSIELTAEDLKNASHRQATQGCESVGDRGAAELHADAGVGLAAAFRKALPVVCSSSAFLADMSIGPELKFKRTKLTRPAILGKKPKKPKKPKTDAALEGNVADGEAEDGTKKKKKKKKKRRRKRKMDIDPAKALAERERDLFCVVFFFSFIGFSLNFIVLL